jgi:hypothetical protein
MSQPAEMLMLQFLAWLAERPRSYAEVMEAWRTSCPRLSVWEDATIDGLVRLAGVDRTMVTLTERGRAFLEGRSRAAAD